MLTKRNFGKTWYKSCIKDISTKRGNKMHPISVRSKWFFNISFLFWINNNKAKYKHFHAWWNGPRENARCVLRWHPKHFATPAFWTKNAIAPIVLRKKQYNGRDCRAGLMLWILSRPNRALQMMENSIRRKLKLSGVGPRWKSSLSPQMKNI